MPLRRTAALLATAIFLLAAASANAASSAWLSIERYDSACKMNVGASTTTPIGYPASVSISIYGDDDPWSPDDYLGYGGLFGFSQPSFFNEFWMPGGCDKLDEDYGGDEIYARMTIFYGQNQLTIRSNNVHGSY
jgi:hypothetical protein